MRVIHRRKVSVVRGDPTREWVWVTELQKKPGPRAYRHGVGFADEVPQRGQEAELVLRGGGHTRGRRAKHASCQRSRLLIKPEERERGQVTTGIRPPAHLVSGVPPSGWKGRTVPEDPEIGDKKNNHFLSMENFRGNS